MMQGYIWCKVKYLLHCQRKIIFKKSCHRTHYAQRHSDCCKVSSPLFQISGWFPVVAIFIPFFYAWESETTERKNFGHPASGKGGKLEGSSWRGQISGYLHLPGGNVQDLRAAEGFTIVVAACNCEFCFRILALSSHSVRRPPSVDKRDIPPYLHYMTF